MSRKKFYGIRNMMAQNPNTWWEDFNISHEFGVLIIFSNKIIFTILLLQYTKWRFIAGSDVIRLKL